MSFIGKVFGNPNDRELKKLRPFVEEINGLEEETEALSDEELRGRTAEFKQEIENGASLELILPEAFAVVREAARRTIGQRHYDVQLIGGIVLHQGKIAEMRTGEGKTLVATLPSYLNALSGKGVHVVTVNDYLVKRDRDWMGRIHEFLGLTVGAVTSDLQPQGPERRAAYAADITYGTNNELGFDYLRDNMIPDISFAAQRDLNFAIVDEVDNILIDEARTPLIISGQAEESTELYVKFAKVVPRLRAEQDYTLDAKTRTVAITDRGIDRIEKMLGIQNLYGDVELTRHLENALKAQVIFERDTDYIVRDGEVLIVDEFTGRVLQGRRYSEGLHQAIEAKEGVRIQSENRTLATITYQNYFRLYEKLSGMTGTALTEAEEFDKIYKLDVVTIPTHRPIARADHVDYIYATEKGKYRAVVDEIKERHERGQPVLVGTTSVDISEMLAKMLAEDGIAHNVLNAKQHAREAHVISQAGRSGAVTIATNMAGRGTDIMLGGSPAGFVDDILREREIDPEEATEEQRAEALEEAKRRCDEDREVVLEAGGLYIIGTERHESRRIDNQLRGRSGRQGDPGESRFYVSLEDDLMRRFGSDRVAGMMGRFGLDDENPIESGTVSKMLEQAQSKVEAYNFDIRKNVVEYDDVISEQRAAIYKDRRAVLEHGNMRERVLGMVGDEIERITREHTTANMPEDWDLDGLVKHLLVWGITVPDEIFPENLNTLRRETLVSELTNLAHQAYTKKEQDVINACVQLEAQAPGILIVSGEETMRAFERGVLLHVVDSLWREHIDRLDEMRSAIGLRGIAQRDPLVEFKREAFIAFEELKASIEQHVTELILRTPVQISIRAPIMPEQLPPGVPLIGSAPQPALVEEAQEAPAQTELAQAELAQAEPAPVAAATNARQVAQAAANGGATAPARGPQPRGAQPILSAQPVAPAQTVQGELANGNGNGHANGQANGQTNGRGTRPKPGAQGNAHGNAHGKHQGRTTAVSASRPANEGTPGRNAPCPCGSGKKYKNCHGR